jgi:solute carrier family 25 phosphate transporter 3
MRPNLKIVNSFLEFGPRGRSPIEREKELDADKVLRFCLSGAICASSAHILLVPIDVIKTRIQTNPEKYKDVATAFKKVTAEQGITGLFSGWDATVLGFFFFGGVTFVATEYFRRFYTDLMGNESSNIELLIILAAAVSAHSCKFRVIFFSTEKIS